MVEYKGFKFSSPFEFICFLGRLTEEEKDLFCQLLLEYDQKLIHDLSVGRE